MGRNIATSILVALIIATIGFIMFNSCQNAESSWEISNSTADIFSPILHAIHNVAVALFGWTQNACILGYEEFVRKLAHFLEYAALGFECALLSIILKQKPLSELTWMAAFVPLATAVTDEFVQGFVGRSSMVSDVLLDFTGACCGIILVTLVSHLVLRVAHR